MDKKCAIDCAIKILDKYKIVWSSDGVVISYENVSRPFDIISLTNDKIICLAELLAYFLNENGCIINFGVQFFRILCRSAEGLKLFWKAF